MTGYSQYSIINQVGCAIILSPVILELYQSLPALNNCPAHRERIEVLFSFPKNQLLQFSLKIKKCTYVRDPNFHKKISRFAGFSIGRKCSMLVFSGVELSPPAYFIENISADYCDLSAIKTDNSFPFEFLYELYGNLGCY